MLTCAILILLNSAIYAVKTAFELSIGLNKITNLFESINILILMVAASFRFVFLNEINNLPLDMDNYQNFFSM